MKKRLGLYDGERENERATDRGNRHTHCSRKPKISLCDSGLLKEPLPWFVEESCPRGVKNRQHVVMDAIDHHQSMATACPAGAKGNLDLMHSDIIREAELSPWIPVILNTIP